MVVRQVSWSPDGKFLYAAIADIDATATVVAQPLAMHSVWLRSLAPYYDEPPPDSDRFYDAYLDFVLRGLRP